MFKCRQCSGALYDGADGFGKYLGCRRCGAQYHLTAKYGHQSWNLPKTGHAYIMVEEPWAYHSTGG